jgi:hypothetical protein
MCLAITTILGIAANNEFIMSLTSVYNLLIISGGLLQIGVVLQDLVADTLCYEIVPKQIDGVNRSKQDIRDEIGLVQQITKIFEIAAAIIGVGISGYVAQHLAYENVAKLIFIVPLLSIVGVLICKDEPKVETQPKNLTLLFGGVGYLGFVACMATIKYDYSQEVVFIVAMFIVISLLYKMCKHLDSKQKKEVLGILLMFFAFRSIPTYSPGVDWWQIDELGFTPKFKANLDQINLFLGFIGVWFFARKALRTDLRKVLLILTLIHVILQLPMIAMSYGLHNFTMEHFGFGARTIAFFDASMEAPFQRLGFLLMTAALTYYAPKKDIASWFALSMGLMSLAFVYSARIIKKYLAKIYIIERGDYHNIKGLLISTASINLILPIVAIMIVSYFCFSNKELQGTNENQNSR